MLMFSCCKPDCLFKIAVRKMSENNMIRKKIVIVGDGACGKERYITTLHTVLSLHGASKIQKVGGQQINFAKRKSANLQTLIFLFTRFADLPLL
jgi:hypothetical protein